jgi:rRNA maturation endonuclease Nob1
MKKCNECKNEYDELNVNIVNPIPDGMCATCGTILTESQIKELKARLNNINE